LGGERDREPCRPAADHPLVVGIVVFISASPTPPIGTPKQHHRPDLRDRL
jgi:hypothetical protein